MVARKNGLTEIVDGTLATHRCAHNLGIFLLADVKDSKMHASSIDDRSSYLFPMVYREEGGESMSTPSSEREILCRSAADFDPSPLTKDLDEEQVDLRRLLIDFDPGFELFPKTTTTENPVEASPETSHKRRVHFEHPEASSPKKFSPVTDEEQRRARNELWKQSLKRSMFSKATSLVSGAP